MTASTFVNATTALRRLALASLVCLAPYLPGQEPAADGSPWTADFAAARDQARAEPGRGLLLFFTGSDWCVWCKKLKADVLEKEAFLEEATRHHVFVELDYPRDTSVLAPETVRQNAELRERYQPNGYPYVILADAEGRPYHMISGYVKGGPGAYLERMRQGYEIRDRLRELEAQAEQAEGAERAKLLGEALQLLPKGTASTFRPEWQALVDRYAASEERTARERAEAFLANRRTGRYRGDHAAYRSAYGRVHDALTAAERAAVERDLAVGEIQDALVAFGMNSGGRGAASVDMDSAAVHEAVARMLSARRTLGSWPRGALGNRALIALAGWADARGDILTFAKVVEELPPTREGLAGTPKIMEFFDARLASLRAGETEDDFFEAFLNRNR